VFENRVSSRKLWRFLSVRLRTKVPPQALPVENLKKMLGPLPPNINSARINTVALPTVLFTREVQMKTLKLR
jgi:hypothetical protein